MSPICSTCAEQNRFLRRVGLSYGNRYHRDLPLPVYSTRHLFLSLWHRAMVEVHTPAHDKPDPAVLHITLSPSHRPSTRSKQPSTPSSTASSTHPTSKLSLPQTHSPLCTLPPLWHQPWTSSSSLVQVKTTCRRDGYAGQSMDMLRDVQGALSTRNGTTAHAGRHCDGGLEVKISDTGKEYSRMHACGSLVGRGLKILEQYLLFFDDY